MNLYRSTSLPLLFAALTLSLSAQPKIAKPIEPARIAYVTSERFLDEATGLKELVRVNQALELEFSGAQSDLSLMNEKLRTIAGEINRLNADPVANAKALEEKQTVGLRLQQEMQAKQQAAQASFQERQQATQRPITDQIAKELRAFGKERDISMLFDTSKLGEALLDAKPELDVTADFIAFYNAKHP